MASHDSKPLRGVDIELFVREYLVNGYDAEKAGERYGAGKGRELIRYPEVQIELKRQRFHVLKRLDITQERILSEVATIAFFDVADYFHDDGRPKPLSEIPAAARRAIASLDVEELYAQSQGEGKVNIGRATKLKLADKNKALDLLSKLMGISVERKEVIHHRVSAPAKVTEEETQLRLAQLVESNCDDFLS